MTSEAHVYADVYHNVRSLTKFYLANARTLDPHHRPVADGKQLNSLYWLVGHLVWTEYSLIHYGVGGEELTIPWLSYFELGSELTTTDALPTFEELLEELDRSHERALEIIRSLNDDELYQPNNVGISFGGNASKRMLLHHAIRHEPCHTGQIGWLCKIHGVKVI